ncbi:hypothetical protein VZG28_05020 [Synechococcus elongatus IITB4]|uniref:hypothetical protein n=1 Tax=Synechococcus elongatus TaxID=32046 RepID=UPI0030CBFEA6
MSIPSFGELMDQFTIAMNGVPEEYQDAVLSELRRRRAQRAVGNSAFLTPSGTRPEPFTSAPLQNNAPNLPNLLNQVLDSQQRAQDLSQQNDREDLLITKDAANFGRENRTIYNRDVNQSNAILSSNLYKSELPFQVAAQKELIRAQGDMFSQVAQAFKPDMQIWADALNGVRQARAELFSR